MISYEERILTQKFPREYGKYAASIPAFFPTAKLYPIITTRFSWQQVIKNKEYNAVLGILLGYALLILLKR